MALEKQNVSISFAGGVDTKTDPKQVQGVPSKNSAGATIPGKLLTLENGIFTSSNRIKKRFGYTYLDSTIEGKAANVPFIGPDLGAADSFAVLAGSAVTNTGISIITGDLGVSPGSSVTGFPPGAVVSGSIHAGDATAAAAQVSLTAAYNDLVLRPFDVDLSGIDLGTASPLIPGVYFFSTSAQLTGTLVLDAQGDPNSVWIFQIGSTLTTASSSTVQVINGGVPGNIYWQVGSSATIGTGTTFLGDILAQVSITVNTGATFSGRALARTGAVTLDTNAITVVSNSEQLPVAELVSNIVRGLGISTYKSELIEFTGEQIYSYSESIMKWSAKGPATSLNVTANEIIRNSYQQTVQDAAIHPSGLQVFTWEDSSGGTKYAVIDSLTGQNIVQNQTLSSTGIKPKPLSLGAYIILLYIDTSDNKIKYRAIAALTPSLIGSPVTVSSTLDPVNKNYDATIIGVRAFVAFNNSDVGGGISIVSINTFLSLSATRDTTGESADSCITIFGDPVTQRVWVAYHNGTQIKYFIRDYNLTPTAVLAPTVIEANSNTILNIAGIANAGLGEVFYTQAAAATYNYFVKRAYLTSLGVVTGVGVFLRSVALASKPFSYNRITYVALVHASVEQPTYFLANDSQVIVAKFTAGLAGGIPAKNMLPQPINFENSKFLLPVLQKDLFTTISGSVYTQTGVSEVTFDFNASNTFFTSELGENLHITGGILSMYDGVSVVEHGFHLFPENVMVSTSATGGLITAGQYQYSVTYEWVDNQGQTHISAPSIPVTVTTTGATSSNTLTIPTLRLTQKVPPRSPISIVIYRTEANGTLFYRVSSITSPLFNDTAVDTVMYVDVTADSAIIGNPLLYTTGGVVENIAAPATNLLTTYKNRIILVPSESPLSFWYSKEVVPGVPVEFSDLFVQNVDQRGGDITATAVLDDKLILFKRTSIFFVNGDGPDAAGGGGSFSPAQLITTDGGCVDSKSVVLTPIGLMYKSEKGIYLLDRSLQVSYVGADVEAYNSDLITSSSLVADTNQVRFCLNTKVALVYDYYFSQWSVFTNIEAVDTTIFQNEFTYLRADGIVAQETPGLFADNNEFIRLKIVTSWLSFAGLQAFQRVYKLLLLGEYNSPHRLYVQVAYDFNPYPTQEDYINATQLMNIHNYGDVSPYGAEDVYGGQFPRYQFRVNLARQKCETIQFSIEDTQSSNYGEGLSLSAMAFEVGAKKGLNKIGASRSFG